jgi:RNA polymerase sigma-70 factor (ECF subfamily)
LLGRFARQPQRPPPEPPELAQAAEEQRLLWHALNELPEGDRLVLYLRYFLDLPEREIAAVIARPAGTVKSRLHRACARLREVIEARYPGLRPGETLTGVRRD